MISKEQFYEFDPIVHSYASVVRSGQTPLLPGLVELEDIQAAVLDPAAVFDEQSGYPLVTDITHNKWYAGLGLYTDAHQIAIDHSAVRYYAGCEALSSASGVEHGASLSLALQHTAETDAALLVEYNSEVDGSPTNELYALEEARSGVSKPSKLVIAEKRPLIQPPAVTYIFNAGYRTEDFPLHAGRSKILEVAYNYQDRSGTPVSLVNSIDVNNYPDLYAQYLNAFREVTKAHPVGSVMGFDDFDEMLRSPDFFKFVVEDDNGLASMCVIGFVDDAYWFDDTYLSRRFPREFDENRLLFCPLIYVREGVDPKRQFSTHIFEHMARVFTDTKVYPRFLVECNGKSGRYIPRLFNWGAKRAGKTPDDWQVLQKQHVEIISFAV